MPPKFVRTALWVNLVLVVVSLAAPRMATGSEAAAMLFAIPMALILAIGAGAAVRAYILSYREYQRPHWTAFLPLAVFLLGIGATLVLVYSDLSWVKPPSEVSPAK